MKDESSNDANSFTFIQTYFLNPGERVHLHQCIWDADHMHLVHDAL